MYSVDLKGIRKRLKLSQYEFAEILKVSQPYLSEIEQEKKPITTLIINNLKKYAYENDLQIDITEEPDATYSVSDKKKDYPEIETFCNADKVYRVPDNNALAGYSQGHILALREIKMKEYAPIGMPYLIQTRTDKLELLRYILDINNEKQTIQIAHDITGKFAQVLPLSEIDHIFTIVSFISQKM